MVTAACVDVSEKSLLRPCIQAVVALIYPQLFLKLFVYTFISNNISLLFHPLSLSPCELLPSLFIRRPSVNISHFNLLLRNHWANWNQTLVEWSLDGPLPQLCPVIPTSNQDAAKLKIEKRGDEILIVHCCFSVSQNGLKF
jgi:hypothetical protein